MRALAIAATGMLAQQLNVEVIANNIANINTTGFKRARAEFTDLLYQIERMPGTAARGGEGVVPEGKALGLGVRTAAIRKLFEQGSLANTGNRLDIALVGRGWFRIQGPDGETLYTRSGAFNRNAQGQLVTIDGYQVLPPITIPQDAIDVIVNPDGQVFARMPNQRELQPLGRLSLALFANDVGLEPIGDNLFRETEASGTAVVGAPGDPGFGQVRQGFLESSNVDAVKEITELITAQRAYEMNSKVIQAVDEMLSTVSRR
ncbi:flagellar basal-body rod protein FlgG [Thermopetrobacter sp. TC1]|uniref:flagellar basal-body rod protein FlgG n=1 Tax=Thermopetrobacter sp. TC1 TaxID=1495045 RepID=UPI000570909A|nr:flagellar basal-body rod protein FlgG [Thermopetrobacter sp. TC1]